MEKVHATWCCPVCGKPTVQIIKIGRRGWNTRPVKLPDFGGYREGTNHNGGYFCKECITDQEMKGGEKE